MPWGMTVMDAKREFVALARQHGVSFRELCRRFAISPTTGYELMRRFRVDAEKGLEPLSRRPLTSPTRTDAEKEALVLSLRDSLHWGARKISHVLARDFGLDVPRSTVHSVLTRQGRIDPADTAKHQPFVRFEHPHPNDLWQIDFKGDIAVGAQRCYPFTALDDHSRFSLALKACADQTTETVQGALIAAFRMYGLPRRITLDNGAPWGDDSTFRLTRVTAWMIRLGIRVSHSRPYHPQTQGKDERFHGSLDRELLRWHAYRDFIEAQKEFDRWRDLYNFYRPHEGLGMMTPSGRYVPSVRTMPEKLPPIEYGIGDHVRTVAATGRINFAGYTIRVGKGCTGLPVAVRPTISDGVFEIIFCTQTIAAVDLRDADKHKVLSTVKPANGMPFADRS